MPRGTVPASEVKQSLELIKTRTGWTWLDVAEKVGCSDRMLLKWRYKAKAVTAELAARVAAVADEVSAYTDEDRDRYVAQLKASRISRRFPVAAIQPLMDVRGITWNDMEREGIKRETRTDLTRAVADKAACVLGLTANLVWPDFNED